MRNSFLWALAISLSYLPTKLCAQQDSAVVNDIARHIQLDSVTIVASRSGFDIPLFIQRVKDDTTFYKAFKTLRVIGFTAENYMWIFDQKDHQVASYESLTRQTRRNGCRTLQVLHEKTTGDFYKNKRKQKYRYYTAEMFAHVFLDPGPVCGEDNLVHGGKPEVKDPNHQIEKHIEELKQLIFNPGQPIPGIPFVGHKVGIFEPDIAPMYHFAIQSKMFGNDSCYVFQAIAKPQFANQLVIDTLITYFRKSDYSIVARQYALSYKTFLFDFNVHIQVDLSSFQHMLVPSWINYIGNWDIAFHRRERVHFTIRFFDFQPEISANKKAEL
ncbi:MAG: hypothetical protein K6T34_08190 [Thermoflavifilum sp.]|nr:hypothetical protein [Thermoflavifilum sp.]